MTTVERLTKQEEIDLLNRLADEGKFYDNGSSRAVYVLDDKTVVKIALDDEGKYQNRMEVDIYQKYDKLDILADIHSYGEFIVVMERVRVIPNEVVEFALERDEEDFTELISESYSDSNYTSEDRDDMIAIVGDLDSILGETTDNYQLGYNTYGGVVSYDYGYDTENHDLCVSGLIGRFLHKYTNRGLILEVVSRLEAEL